MSIPVGSQSKRVYFQLLDDSGLPVAGKLAATITDLFYASGDNSPVAIALVDLASPTAPWVSGGIIETVDGWYHLCIPNAAWEQEGQFNLIGEETNQHVIFTPLDIVSASESVSVESTGDVGAIDAYISTSDADIYFSTKLHAKAWNRASESDRVKSAIEATRIIDRLVYAGCKADSAQQHEFPRKALIEKLHPKCPPEYVIDTEVPTAIRQACCEIMLELLDGVDPQKEYNALSITSTGMNGVRDTYNRFSLPEHIVAGIPSIVAWQLIKPYLRAAREVKLSRV